MPRSDRRCKEEHEPHPYQNGGERSEVLGCVPFEQGVGDFSED